LARPRPTTPEGGLGQAEDGVLGRDPEIAGQGQLAASAQGYSVDRGDRDGFMGLHRGHEPGVDGGKGVVPLARADGPDVRAGDETLAARSSPRARWISSTVSVSRALRFSSRLTVSVPRRPSMVRTRFR
jgi:hypothetical protein